MSKPAPLIKRKSVIQFVEERQDEKELRDLFQIADKQKVGSVGPSQLRIILKELGVHANEEESQLLFEGLDVNNDGRISFQEFTAGITWLKKSIVLHSPRPAGPAAAAEKPSVPPLHKRISFADFTQKGDAPTLERCKQLFSLMDEQHKGEISLGRFTSVFKSLSQELDVSSTDAEIADLFKQLDVNADGTISFQEFLSGMQRLNKAYSATSKLTESAKVAVSLDESLQTENALLKRYLRENLVERGIRGAERAVATNDFASAKLILELLDMPRVEKLEEYVGTLTTIELNDRYESCRQSVAKSLQKP